MPFRTYSASEQTQLTQDIRATASHHQTTSLYLWRTALEQLNPEVITVALLYEERAAQRIRPA